MKIKFPIHSSSFYESFKPIFYYAKLIGYWPETFKVNLEYLKKKLLLPYLFQKTEKGYTYLSLIHFVFLLIGNTLLLYYVAHLEPYRNATKSAILNYGLWIQTIFSMIMSISFMLVSIIKRKEKWNLMEKCTQIEEIFQQKFYVQFDYDGYLR